MPGREDRFGEPPVESMDALMNGLVAELRPLVETGCHYVLFGHSLGAWIAYAAAQRLVQQGCPQPSHLIVSACPAPHIASTLPAIHTLPDAAFLAEIQSRYDRLPALILNDAQVLALFLRVLRADLTLFETARWPEKITPLSASVTACCGLEDRMIGSSELSAWREHTSGTFDVQWFAGGHHYHRAQPPSLLRLIETACRHTK